MLWRQYVYRRGDEVCDMWDDLFEGRPLRILYISGRGFDGRARVTLDRFVQNCQESRRAIVEAKLVLVGFSGYQLSEDLVERTRIISEELTQRFSVLGSIVDVSVNAPDDEELTPQAVLRRGVEQVLAHVADQTDIVLDISSLPRTAYLALMTALLRRLVHRT